MTNLSAFQHSVRGVGIELMKGEVADAVLEAVRESHDDVRVSDLPGYIIIEVDTKLDLTAQQVRDQLGNPDWVMTDLNEFTAVVTGNVEMYTEDRLVVSKPVS